jgi:hypothetical protein
MLHTASCSGASSSQYGLHLGASCLPGRAAAGGVLMRWLAASVHGRMTSAARPVPSRGAAPSRDSLPPTSTQLWLPTARSRAALSNSHCCCGTAPPPLQGATRTASSLTAPHRLMFHNGAGF